MTDDHAPAADVSEERGPASPLERRPAVSWKFSVLSLAVMVLVALVLRAPTYPRVVWQFDEMVYVVLADTLLDGGTVFVDAYDIKPIGVYLFFAAAIALAGGSLVGYKILAAVFVGVGAWLLGLVAARVAGRDGPLVRTLPGLFLVFAYHTGNTLSVNTEQIALPFLLASAVFCLDAWRAGTLKKVIFTAIPVGLCFGIAMQIRPQAGLDGLGIGLTCLALAPGGDGPWIRRAAARAAVLAVATIGFTLALLGITAAYYASIGHLDTFTAVQFEHPLAYSSVRMGLDYALEIGLDYFQTFGVIWAMPATAALLALVAPSAAPLRPVLAVLAWFGLAALGFVASGQYWGHYLHPALVPACLAVAFAARALDDAEVPRPARRAAVIVPVAAAFIALPGVPFFAQTMRAGIALAQGQPVDGGPQQRMADAFGEFIQPGDAVANFGNGRLVYLLTDAERVGRFPFERHITNRTLGESLGFDVDAEVEAMLDQAEWVIMPLNWRDRVPGPAFRTSDGYHRVSETDETLMLRIETRVTPPVATAEGHTLHRVIDADNETGAPPPGDLRPPIHETP